MGIRASASAGRHPALLVIAALVVFTAGSATAGVLVYHSPNVNYGNPLVHGLPIEVVPASLSPGALHSFELFIVKDQGLATGTGVPCLNGDGQETCGFDLRIRAQDGATFTNFSASTLLPNDTIVGQLDLSFTELRVNGTHTDIPDPPNESVPVHIGTLGVQAPLDSGGQVRVDWGRHVDAAGLLSAVPEQIVAVPEPTELLLLGCGALLLRFLERRRLGACGPGSR